MKIYIVVVNDDKFIDGLCFDGGDPAIYTDAANAELRVAQLRDMNPDSTYTTIEKELPNAE